MNLSDAQELEDIRRAAYLGDATRSPEHDVRFLLYLLDRQRVTCADCDADEKRATKKPAPIEEPA